MTIRITGLPGCHGNTFTMTTRELHDNSAVQIYFKFIFSTYSFMPICITGQSYCYGRYIEFTEGKSIRLEKLYHSATLLPWNYCYHGNQKNVQELECLL